MKKILSAILAMSLAFAVTSCGKNTNDTNKEPMGENQSGEDQSDSGSSDKEEVSDTVSLLQKIWDSYGEDEKFSAAGGDYSEENAVQGGPGKYSLESPEALDASLGIPENSVSMIDDAASLMHMMNANTFTCGAYHVKKSDDISALADSLKENILNRQWMCGFPDKLVIFSIGDNVVSAFGDGEIIDTFKTKLTESYSSAKLIDESPIE